MNYDCLYLFLAVLGLLLFTAFLELCRAGPALRRSPQASHCDGFSCCGAQALGWGLQQLWLPGSRAEAQELRHMGLAGLQRVGSSPSEVSVSAHPHICVFLVLASLDFLFHAI